MIVNTHKQNYSLKKRFLISKEIGASRTEEGKKTEVEDRRGKAASHENFGGCVSISWRI